jgi:hypothetical protein
VSLVFGASGTKRTIFFRQNRAGHCQNAYGRCDWGLIAAWLSLIGCAEKAQSRCGYALFVVPFDTQSQAEKEEKKGYFFKHADCQDFANYRKFRVF